MKKYRTTIIAVAVLIIAIAGFIVGTKIIEKNNADATATEDPEISVNSEAICSFLANNVSKLTVHNEEDFVIVRVSDSEWTCTSHESLEIYDTATYDICTSFGNLSGVVIIDGDEEEINYKNFGLSEEDEPKWIRVLLKDGTSKTLYMGKTNLSGSRTYVRLEGKNKIYAISTSTAKTFKATRASFIYLYPFKFDDDDKINVLQMQKSGAPSLYATAAYTEDSEEKTWKLTEPVKRGGNAENISVLISSLTSIKLTEVIESDCTDLSKYGLDNPETKYTLKDASFKTKTVSVGNMTADGKYYYCTFNNGNDVYSVEKAYFAYKDTDLLQFIDVYTFLEQYSVLSHVDINVNDEFGQSSFTMDIIEEEKAKKDSDGNIVKDTKGDPVYETIETFKFNGTELTTDEETDLFKKVTTSIYLLRIAVLDLNPSEPGETIVSVLYTRKDGSTVLVEGKRRSEDTMYLYVDGEYCGGYCKISRVSSLTTEYSIRIATNNLLEEMAK